MNKIDYTIEKTDASNDPILGSYLALLFKGDSIDNSIVNTLRRVSLSEIPIYAISESSVYIKKNTSIYDNDYMRQRLSMIPLRNLDYAEKFDCLESKYYPYVSGVYGLIYPDKEYPKDPRDTLDLKIYINVTNENTNVLSVTTNDCKVYVDNKEVDYVFDKKYPRALLKLRKGQEFKADIHATLGIAKVHDAWSAISMPAYRQINANEYSLTINSLGQMNEYTILRKACQWVKLKLENTKKALNSNPKATGSKDISTIVLELENENHTLGNLLKTTLNRHSKVNFSGYKKDHPQMEVITIALSTQKIEPFTIINECIDYLLELFDTIYNNLTEVEQGKKLTKKLKSVKTKTKGKPSTTKKTKTKTI